MNLKKIATVAISFAVGYTALYSFKNGELPFAQHFEHDQDGGSIVEVEPARDDLKSGLRFMAEKINSTAPMRLDSVTTLMSVIAVDNTLMIRHVVDHKELGISNQKAMSFLEDYIRTTGSTEICSGPLFEIIDMGAQITRHYQFDDGRFFMDFKVDSGICMDRDGELEMAKHMQRHPTFYEAAELEAMAAQLNPSI